MLARLTETIVDGRRHVRPDPRIVRQLRGRRNVAVITVARPVREILDFRMLRARQIRIAPRKLEAMETDVIRAPLQQGDVDVERERAAHERNVALEQLILQRLSSPWR